MSDREPRAPYFLQTQPVYKKGEDEDMQREAETRYLPGLPAVSTS